MERAASGSVGILPNGAVVRVVSLGFQRLVAAAAHQHEPEEHQQAQRDHPRQQEVRERTGSRAGELDAIRFLSESNSRRASIMLTV